MKLHATRTLLWLSIITACEAPIDPTPRKTGLDLPTEWSSIDANSDPVRAEWWREFGGELPGLVDRAFAFNRDLAGAAARFATAAAEAKAAGADLGPQFDASFGARRDRQNFIGLPIPGATSDVLSTTVSAFNLGLNLTWEIDLWGRIRAGELRSQRELEASAADFRGARLSLAAQTAQSWFALVEARAQLELAEQTAQLFAVSADRIRARFERGVRSSLDLRLAMTELENARAIAAQRRGAVDRVGRSLQVLIGEYPDGGVGDTAALPELPPPVPAGIPAQILGRRPDLVAAERRLAAADANVAQAKAALYPALSLTASGGTRSQDIEDLLDGDFRVWSLATNVIAPIVDWGRRRSRIDIGEARRHQAYAAWASAVLQALREVETALVTEEHLAAQQRFVAAASDEAAAARTLSEDRYSRGLIDVITLLTAQRRDVTARSGLIALQRRRLDARIDLLLALGGGIETAPTPTPTEEEQ